MPMIHRKADLNNASGESSPFPEDSMKKGMGASGKFYRVAGFLCFLALFTVLVTHNGTKSDLGDGMGFSTTLATKKKKSKGRPSSPMDDYPDLEKAFTKYDNCEIKWTPPPPRDSKDWAKPLWLTAFPASGTASPTGKGDIMKPLINGITGLRAGGKFYHASSKILKRCKGQDETATCSQGHPVVNTGPEKQVDNFFHSMILMTRNYRTAFPAHINEKHEAYHGGTEQVDENSWRGHRDQWYKEVFNGWKSVITAWKAMEKDKVYDIGAYIQYEEMMDPERGPAAVERIADLLQTAGFQVAPKDDLPCIWFKIVKDEYLRLKEYCKFSYGYTEEQQSYILQELETLQKEFADDQKLVVILKEYYEDIRDNLYIDVPQQTT